MIAALSVTLGSISGASERENRHVKYLTKFWILSSVTLATHFLIVMVVLANFHWQMMYQGYHSQADSGILSH